MTQSLHNVQAAADRIEQMQNQMGQEPDRATSVAKEVSPLPSGSLNSKAPNLAGSFQQGIEADQPPARSDERSTPPSGNVPEALQGTGLEAAGRVGPAFHEAANDSAPPVQADPRPVAEMVRDSKPQPYPAPDMPERREVDRGVFNDKWEQARVNSAEVQPDVQAAADRIEQMQGEMGRGRGNGMGMG